MNITLTYEDFLNLFQDCCDYDLTKTEWWTVYNYFSEISIKKSVQAGVIKDCLEWYMDDLAFLFGDFETWDDYMENRRENDDISH